jgi:hypothetical protein
LFPSALSEFFSELDCFQALGIKRYTLGGFVTATVLSDSVSVDVTGFLPVRAVLSRQPVTNE